MPDDFVRGGTAPLSLTVLDGAGEPVDPATLTLTIRTPSGTSIEHVGFADVALVKSDVGVYAHILRLAETGVYVYEWQTTTPDKVQGGRLTVRGTPLDTLPWSLSLEALKRRLDRELDSDDDRLRDYLEAAVLQAQAPHPYGCGRLLTPDPPNPTDAPVTRMVKVRRGRALIADASLITSVTIGGAAVDGYELVRKDGYVVQVKRLPLTATEALITGRFGFTTIPGNLADAIYVLAGRSSYEQAAQYSDQVQILEEGAVHSYYRQLPVRTKMVFATYAVPMAIVGLA